MIFLKKFSLPSLKLIWEKEILCSWSSLVFVWAYQKQHMKISSKVIDIQEGYNKKLSWRSLDKINLIPCNSFEIWWCDMWIMLMSNYALVRILVLRFVIPYASTKANSHAMKYIILVVHYSVLLMLNAWVRDFSLFGWSLLNLFASHHFALSMITTCASKTL